MDNDCISYRINDEDKIVYLDENWQSFADENLASMLNAEKVLNRPIYDFVADVNTREIYRLLFERVRSEPKLISFPFRCDSPEKRRYMVMDVYSEGNGLITLKSCTLREEVRDAVLLLDTSIDRSDEFITICSWCKKVKLDDDWREIESADELLNFASETKLPNLSHGMCNDCYNKIKGELRLSRKLDS